MLSLTDVSVAYDDVPAVRHVSLDLPDGEVLAVLGPSGCGKSTLLRAVAGLEPLTGGGIAFDGSLVDHLPTHRRGFALMFQDGQLFGHMTVARNVGYALRLRRKPTTASARARATRWRSPPESVAGRRSSYPSSPTSASSSRTRAVEGLRRSRRA